jgi:S1-C subfamily serine protease
MALMKFQQNLVGTDPKTDIAVLKIDPEAVEIQC